MDHSLHDREGNSPPVIDTGLKTPCLPAGASSHGLVWTMLILASRNPGRGNRAYAVGNLWAPLLLNTSHYIPQIH